MCIHDLRVLTKEDLRLKITSSTQATPRFVKVQENHEIQWTNYWYTSIYKESS